MGASEEIPWAPCREPEDSFLPKGFGTHGVEVGREGRLASAEGLRAGAPWALASGRAVFPLGRIATPEREDARTHSMASSVSSAASSMPSPVSSAASSEAS